ncbi:MAG TPA: hypothetical protein VJ742_12965 [Nitrososphaera sp.]|nr:hypothetical protein [Nitrososphaera sp.]
MSVPSRKQQRELIVADEGLTPVYWAYTHQQGPTEGLRRADRERQRQEEYEERNRKEFVPDEDLVQAGWDAMWDG